MGVMLMYPHKFDVALRGITFDYATLSFSLVGYPCSRIFICAISHHTKLATFSVMPRL